MAQDWLPQNDGVDSVWQELPSEGSTIALPVPIDDGQPSHWVTQIPEGSTMTQAEYEATQNAENFAAQALASKNAADLTRVAVATEYADIVSRHADIVMRADGLDEVAAGLDAAVAAVDEDRAQTGLDRIATAGDAAQTGADRIATGLDRIATGQDKAVTAADRTQTGQDRVQTGQDRTQTGQDRIATGQDKTATAADRVQTGQDKTAASGSATTASNAATAALGYRDTAFGYRNAAEGFKNDAEAAAAAAATFNPANYVPVTRTVAGKALSANITLAKTDVGLNNVDNTSDVNKPVSTLQAAAIAAKIDKSLLDDIFVGMIFDCPFDTLPPGCVYAAGQNLNRATYAKLFAKYGTLYGVGDGSTTFGVPDRRGRIGVGRDNMGGLSANRVTDTASGIFGYMTGFAGGSQHMPSHSHSATTSTSVTTSVTTTNPGSDQVIARDTANGTFNITTGGNVNGYTGGAVQATSSASSSTTVDAAGVGLSANMPPVMVTNMVIYTGV